MMLRFARVRRAGFTLIEIMIVIAIIAILAAVVVPNVARARFEAGLTACQENCRIGLEAVQMAKIRHTGEQLANLLGAEPGPITPGWEVCQGQLSEPFVEAGYLARPLKCSTTGSFYLFQEYVKSGYGCSFSRDPEGTQQVTIGGGFRCVRCPGSHRIPAGGVCTPCYEESLGACFW